MKGPKPRHIAKRGGREEPRGVRLSGVQVFPN